jgi:hypothetical protein
MTELRVNESYTGESLKFRNLRLAYQRFLICRELVKTNKIHFVKQSSIDKLMFLGFLDYSRLPKVLDYMIAIPNKIHGFFTSKIYIPMSNKIYNSIVNNLSWWPIDLFEFKKRNKSYEEKRIAYYLWHFPVLSQTFVQREIDALRESGLSVVVIADAPEDSEPLDESSMSLIRSTHYLLPMEGKLISKYKKHFFLKNPLLYLNLFFLYSYT